MTPGVSILKKRERRFSNMNSHNYRADAHLAFKVLHDIQKLFVYFRIVLELIPNCVQITQSIRYIQGSAHLWRMSLAGGTGRRVISLWPWCGRLRRPGVHVERSRWHKCVKKDRRVRVERDKGLR
jgi:hypothetical protein